MEIDKNKMCVCKCVIQCVMLKALIKAENGKRRHEKPSFQRFKPVQESRTASNLLCHQIYHSLLSLWLYWPLTHASVSHSPIYPAEIGKMVKKWQMAVVRCILGDLTSNIYLVHFHGKQNTFNSLNNAFYVGVWKVCYSKLFDNLL